MVGGNRSVTKPLHTKVVNETFLFERYQGFLHLWLRSNHISETNENKTHETKSNLWKIFHGQKFGCYYYFVSIYSLVKITKVKLTNITYLLSCKPHRHFIHGGKLYVTNMQLRNKDNFSEKWYLKYSLTERWHSETLQCWITYIRGGQPTARRPPAAREMSQEIDKKSSISHHQKKRASCIEFIPTNDAVR